MRIQVELKGTTAAIWCAHHERLVEFENANRLKGVLDLSMSACTYWDNTEEGRKAYLDLATEGITSELEAEIVKCRDSWLLIIIDEKEPASDNF